MTRIKAFFSGIWSRIKGFGAWSKSKTGCVIWLIFVLLFCAAAFATQTLYGEGWILGPHAWAFIVANWLYVLFALLIWGLFLGFITALWKLGGWWRIAVIVIAILLFLAFCVAPAVWEFFRMGMEGTELAPYF